jgi:hypothetical protein
MEKGLQNVFHLWVLLVDTWCKLAKPHDMHVSIIFLLELLVARYLIVKDLVIVAEAWQDHSIREKLIQILHLMSYFRPHSMPVICFAILRRKPMPYEISQQ